MLAGASPPSPPPNPMDLDLSDFALGGSGGDGEGWPFDALTDSLFFSSSTPQPPVTVLPPLANSTAGTSFGLPPSPLWLFEDRHMEARAASGAAAAEEDENLQLPRGSDNAGAFNKEVYQVMKTLRAQPSMQNGSAKYFSGIKERLTQALRYLKSSANEHLLVQVWAPVKSGDSYMLTTSGQPFVHVEQSGGLYEYRAVSVGYKFSVDGNDDEDLGLPGRVYKQRVPEWTPNVQYYSIKEYRRLKHAIDFNVHGTVALPVFDPSSLSCVAVVELVMTSKKINYASEVDTVCKALEAVNLKSTEIVDHPSVQICNEGRQAALVEILEIIAVACEEHKLPLAQTWVPCKHRSVLAYGGGLQKSCSSIDGSCMGDVCISTSDVAFHVIDAHVWGFRDACAEHHLQKGQGVVGKAYLSGRPCFSHDVSKYSKSKYPLVHYARMFGLAASFAICTWSTHTGTDNYILEFFLPPEVKNEDEQRSLLASMLTVMSKRVRSLRVAGEKYLNKLISEVIGTIVNDAFNNGQNEDYGLYKSLEGDIHEDQYDHEKDGDCFLVDRCAQSDVGIAVDLNSMQNSNCLQPDENSKRAEKKRGKAEKMISLEVLQQYFSGSLKNAAKSLGVCPTTMKRICRQHGITRWPSRKINKVNRSLTKLKEVIESVQGSDNALAYASITGPLPIPVASGPLPIPAASSDPPDLNMPHSNDIVVNNGEKLSSVPWEREAGAQHSVHESNLAFLAPTGVVQQEPGGNALCSRSSSGDACSNSHTSEGSCQASRVNELPVCRPMDSPFLQLHECPWNPKGSVEPAQELQLPLKGMPIRDCGSSKDLKLLSGNAVEVSPEANHRPNPQNPSTVTIKACYKEDIVRFRFPCEQSTTLLKDEIAKRLDLEVDMFDVKFLDDDDEWVKLACDADLKECIDISKLAGRQVIRLSVTDLTPALGSSYGSSG